MGKQYQRIARCYVKNVIELNRGYKNDGGERGVGSWVLWYNKKISGRRWTSTTFVLVGLFGYQESELFDFKFFLKIVITIINHMSIFNNSFSSRRNI